MPEAQCGFINIPGGSSGSSMLTTYGPTLTVDIGFDPQFRPNQTTIPIPGMTGIPALVDTGAQQSCIDSALAAHLNLPIIDRRRICGANGESEVNIHLAQIRIPVLNQNIYGGFAGVHLSVGGQPHLALIGRTFLRHCALIYDGRTGAVRIITPDPPNAPPPIALPPPPPPAALPPST